MSYSSLRSGSGSRSGPYPPGGNGNNDKLPPRPPSPANARSVNLLPKRPRSRSSPDDRSRGSNRPSRQDTGGRNSNRDTGHDDRGSGDRWQPPRGDFSFRQQKPAGIAESYDSYRPRDDRRDSHRDGRPGAPRYPPPPGPSRPNSHRQRDRGDRGGRGRGRFGGRPPFRPFVAAERELLNMAHSIGDEHALFDTEGGVTYRPMDQLSDSDEAAMDISGDEAAQDEAGEEPLAKRPRASENQPSANEGDSAPKWSNPDPYTALPPPAASMNKKRDVVQMIRKARVQAEDARGAVPAEAADFISFDFDSDDAADDVGELPMPPPRAPTGPRHLSAPSYPVQQPVSHGLPAKPPVPADKAHNMPSLGADLEGNHERRTEESCVRMPPPPLPSTLPPPPGQSDASLGSRKRTHEDEVKFPVMARPKKPGKPSGLIKDEWQCVAGGDPCPWMRADHSGTPVPTVRLHKEIVDFYDYVKPQDFEDRIRNEVVNNLRQSVQRKFSDADVLPFGSFPSGLYLPTGDMDLVFVSQQFRTSGRPKYHTKKTLYQFSAMVRSFNLAHDENVEVISKAKVPLVKYVDARTGLRMDLSFENLNGVQAIKTFLAWKEQYPAMPCLVTLIKHFLCMRGLNEPVNGGIGGFSVICLVVSMLQMMPSVQSGNLVTTHCLGDLLMHFFLLYGHELDYRNVAISMNPPRYIAKRDVSAFTYKNPDRLSIIDPNNAENDVSGGSSNWPLIQQAFAMAHEQLEKRMAQLAQNPSSNDGGLDSILAVILAGNYSSFQTQRAHLCRLPSPDALGSFPSPKGNNRSGGHGGGPRQADGVKEDQPGEILNSDQRRQLRRHRKHLRR